MPTFLFPLSAALLYDEEDPAEAVAIHRDRVPGRGLVVAVNTADVTAFDLNVHVGYEAGATTPTIAGIHVHPGARPAMAYSAPELTLAQQLEHAEHMVTQARERLADVEEAPGLSPSERREKLAIRRENVDECETQVRTLRAALDYELEGKPGLLDGPTGAAARAQVTASAKLRDAVASELEGERAISAADAAPASDDVKAQAIADGAVPDLEKQLAAIDAEIAAEGGAE